jgi:hypothetical protein
MKKHLFGVALTCLLVAGGIASAQTIDDIQVYDPLTGAPASPYVGQTVTVSGILVERFDYSGGSGYLWNAGDGGISIYGTGGDAAAKWDEVSVQGTVASFSGEIQLSNPVFTFLSAGNTATPVDLTVTQALSDYENVGTYTRCVGTVTSKGSNNFFLTDGTDTIQVYIDSTTGINIGAVDVGDLYQVTSPLVVFNGEIELKPTEQGFLVENPGGDTVPVISNVNCANWVPAAADPIVVSANIVDDDAVSSANVWYRDSDGVTPGAWMSAAMSNTGGDVWSGTIPGGHSASMVDFYVEATDSGAQTVTQPGDAPAGFFTVAVGMTSIYDMQYVHPDSASQGAALDGQFLNISGVVTAAGLTQAGAASKFIVQEPEVSPDWGTYAFGAVLVYESSAKYPYFQGDVVEIGGVCDEYFGQTEMIPHNAEAVNLVAFGSDLPPASRVDTRTLADDNAADVDGDGFMGEAWESVWVEAHLAAVVDTTGFAQYNEWDISSTGAKADSLIVDSFSQLAYSAQLGDVVSVTSWLDYNFGSFRLRPIDDSYVVLSGATAVGDETPTVERLGGFRAIAPNPFNPITKIQFAVNHSSLVQLNVYNIRGEKVRTLVQDTLPANEYTMAWDGTDDSGRSVASGSYFARLRIGKEVVQVRQMQLVK